MNNLSSIKMTIPRGPLTQVKSFVLVRENTGSKMNPSDGRGTIAGLVIDLMH